MKTNLSFLFIVLITTLISCKKEKSDPKNENISVIELKGSASEYSDLKSNPSSGTSDPFELGDIVINGDKVEITVSYPGGCTQHAFEIVWDETVTNSNPTTINLVIIHDAQGDICEAYITEVLTFALDDLLGSTATAGVSIDGYSGYSASDSAFCDVDKIDFYFEESDICNTTVTAKAAICGWGLYDNIWFALADSVSTGIAGFYFNRYLQPVSIDESLNAFRPVPGNKYSIGARIDNSPVNLPSTPVCMAYPGPSVPVKIMCITEVK
ncbi:MAG: hypothetical protein NT144_00990 [Bacteroidia bacterium]|nr:hypothetical protein [Bacteroidia bacterium]